MAKKDSALVRYGNELNRAASRLDVVEQRIILNALAKVPADKPITQETIFYVTAEDMIDLGSDKRSVYRDMRAAADTLFNRYVTLIEQDAKNRHVKIKFRYVQSVCYIDEEARIGLRFSYDILPFVNQLREQFTQRGLLETRGMRSSYAVRIYGILSQFRTTGKCSIKVADLRHRLGLEDRFKQYGAFKRFVLQRALSQINEAERTAFTVSMREKKLGHRVETLIFTLTPKEAQAPENFAEAHTVDLVSHLTAAQCTLTDKQADMYADWLSKESPACQARRAHYLKLTTHQIFEAMRKMNLNPDGSSATSFNAWLKRKLREPDFVAVIYEDFLEPLGFQIMR